MKKRRLPPSLLFTIFLLASIVMLTIWAREGTSGTLHNVRTVAQTVTAPLSHIGSFLAVPFRALSNMGADATATTETLTELRLQNDELSSIVMRLEEERLENERLSALLGLVDAYSMQSTAARILSHSSDSWNQVITIDKGAKDGLAVGMPVMSANGLLGQLETVGTFSSTVRLITDPSSGVAIFLQANRSEGILSGSVDGILYLNYMSVELDIVPGDVVITSGAGGVYPKGIVIGEVVNVSKSVSDVYLTIIVKPVTRVDSFEEVAVLTGRQASVTYKPISSGGN